MDPITRLSVFSISAVVVFVIWGFVYTKVTGKHFIVIDKNGTKGENSDASTSPLNRQMSPLMIASFAALAALGLIYYQYSDLLRGVIVGAIVFPVLFWVVWKGQKLEENRKTKSVSNE
jgi:Flp pilus assembly protein TadB